MGMKPSGRALGFDAFTQEREGGEEEEENEESKEKGLSGLWEVFYLELIRSSWWEPMAKSSPHGAWKQRGRLACSHISFRGTSPITPFPGLESASFLRVYPSPCH